MISWPWCLMRSRRNRHVTTNQTMPGVCGGIGLSCKRVSGEQVMLKKYKMGFDIWWLILFLVIMIPNFIWFAVPAPNDILRVESVTKVADVIGSVSQVLMVFALCVFIQRDRKKLNFTSLIIATIVCCLTYFLCWILYYMGMTGALVILGLTICPCLAFLCFAIDRKNIIAVLPISVFTICHFIYGLVNFVV